MTANITLERIIVSVCGVRYTVKYSAASNCAVQYIQCIQARRDSHRRSEMLDLNTLPLSPCVCVCVGGRVCVCVARMLGGTVGKQ
jgi:hypothetical protein